MIVHADVGRTVGTAHLRLRIRRPEDCPTVVLALSNGRSDLVEDGFANERANALESMGACNTSQQDILVDGSLQANDMLHQ